MFKESIQTSSFSLWWQSDIANAGYRCLDRQHFSIPQHSQRKQTCYRNQNDYHQSYSHHLPKAFMVFYRIQKKRWKQKRDVIQRFALILIRNMRYWKPRYKSVKCSSEVNLQKYAYFCFSMFENTIKLLIWLS